MSATTISSYPTAITFRPNATLPAISYTLPASLFSSVQTAVQLTLNLCSAPEGFNQSQLDIFTAFTNDTWTYGSRLYGGFGNITVPVISLNEHVSGSVSNGDLVIHLDTQTQSGRGRPEDWTFELGIAQADTPWHTLDKVPLFAFEDSDNTTALLTSPTYSAAMTDGHPSYTPLLALTSDIRNDLANSSCYVRSLPQVGGRNITSSTTRRGVVELDIAEGGQVNETQALGRKVQYAIGGLETGSNYTVWGVQPREGQTLDGSGRLFSRQFLATKRGELPRLFIAQQYANYNGPEQMRIAVCYLMSPSVRTLLTACQPHQLSTQMLFWTYITLRSLHTSKASISRYQPLPAGARCVASRACSLACGRARSA